MCACILPSIGEHLPKAHLTGVLDATGPLKMFWNWDNVAKDGNLLPTVLLETLHQTKLQRGGKLPKVLLLQLDNTARENKNKYVMAFLAFLVDTGVFEEIWVNFLLVGHTHEVRKQL
jgi:hypothetical protein